MYVSENLRACHPEGGFVCFYHGVVSVPVGIVNFALFSSELNEIISCTKDWPKQDGRDNSPHDGASRELRIQYGAWLHNAFRLLHLQYGFFRFFAWLSVV